jgi:NADP-dependent 3-hydroxy acid dehydrogenase YdfG
MAANSGGRGRVALITGGMGGLGETIATKMVDAGYTLLLGEVMTRTCRQPPRRQHAGA